MASAESLALPISQPDPKLEAVGLSQDENNAVDSKQPAPSEAQDQTDVILEDAAEPTDVLKGDNQMKQADPSEVSLATQQVQELVQDDLGVIDSAESKPATAVVSVKPCATVIGETVEPSVEVPVEPSVEVPEKAEASTEILEVPTVEVPEEIEVVAEPFGEVAHDSEVSAHLSVQPSVPAPAPVAVCGKVIEEPSQTVPGDVSAEGVEMPLSSNQVVENSNMSLMSTMEGRRDASASINSAAAGLAHMFATNIVLESAAREILEEDRTERDATSDDEVSETDAIQHVIEGAVQATKQVVGEASPAVLFRQPEDERIEESADDVADEPRADLAEAQAEVVPESTTEGAVQRAEESLPYQMGESTSEQDHSSTRANDESCTMEHPAASVEDGNEELVQRSSERVDDREEPSAVVDASVEGDANVAEGLAPEIQQWLPQEESKATSQTPHSKRHNARSVKRKRKKGKKGGNRRSV